MEVEIEWTCKRHCRRNNKYRQFVGYVRNLNIGGHIILKDVNKIELLY
jgi:hypothetical protein